mmetsp:Transcript_25471/g.40530  ORF Transcript_25471/g.40530 Transcript_25471/m.40530 type:complete len:192 (-) Transcript_25471:23-598(-)
MPVKTEADVFSEEKIYPGHGVNFVRRDGKKFTFVSCKTRHLFLAGRKALDNRWTKAWRRAHKKESILRSVKKDKGRRTIKSERGIEGLSLQELLRRKNESAEQRKAALAKKQSGVVEAPKRPTTKAAKKADLNARLRALRKKRKEAEEQKSSAPASAPKKAQGKKKGGGGKKPAKAAAGGKKGGGKKKGKK